MSKTYRDLKRFDTKRHKEGARETFKEVDMRTRVKPIEKREKGGGNNWKNRIDHHLEAQYEDQFYIEE